MSDYPRLVCLGLNHRTAPIQLREQLYCTIDDLATLAGLTAPNGLEHQPASLQELALLATCNRLELYAVVSGSSTPWLMLVQLLAVATGVREATVGDHTVHWEDLEVMHHLAHVACGLDSLVLGEPQILGQVGDAFRWASQRRLAGPILDLLSQHVLQAGRRARCETAIGLRSASISSVAVSLAEQALGTLAGCTAVVVGAGAMGQQAAKALRGRRVGRLLICNRTRERAQLLAQEVHGEVCSFDMLAPALAAADVVVNATGGHEYLITAPLAAAALAQRRGRPLIVADVSMPRTVDPAVRRIAGIQLFDIDHLRGELDETMATRRLAVPAVEEIIAAQCDAFAADLRLLSVQPVVADLHRKAEAIRQRELQRTVRQFGDHLDSETLDHLQHLSQALVRKILHEPTMVLRSKAGAGEAEPYAAAVAELFGLTAYDEEGAL